MADLAVGVIGTGGMGARHAHNIDRYVAGAYVAGVYDLDRERARSIAAACGAARVFDDPHDLIGDPAVDAVVIVSPDPTHAMFVHACLSTRKPVLCEKPLATSTEEARSVVEAEQAFGHRLISVGFMRRFDPQHVAVKQAVDAGAIGRPFLFKGVHRNARIQPNLPGTAAITSSTVHDIDSARWMLEQEITEVYVRGVRTHPSFSDDTRDLVLVQMTLTGDCLATVETSVAIEYGYEVSAEIVGERGTACTLSPADAVISSNAARAIAVPQSHLERFQAAFVPEMIDWVESVRSGRTFAGASAWDGLMATVVSDACLESLRVGTPVPVATPSRPDLYRTGVSEKPDVGS